MQQGWIKIHRKIKEKGYYKKSAYIHLWFHLLLSANHKEREFMWNGQIIMVKEGQLITGRKELSKQTGIPPTTIERILKMLESGHQIGQQKTSKYRLITILNWDTHQKTDIKTDNKRTSNGHKQECKNVKNEMKRENSISYLKEIPLEDIKEFKKKYNVNTTDIKQKADNLINYCESKGRVYKNYKSFLKSALSKDFGLK